MLSLWPHWARFHSAAEGEWSLGAVGSSSNLPRDRTVRRCRDRARAIFPRKVKAKSAPRLAVEVMSQHFDDVLSDPDVPGIVVADMDDNGVGPRRHYSAKFPVSQQCPIEEIRAGRSEIMGDSPPAPADRRYVCYRPPRRSTQGNGPGPPLPEAR